MSAFFISLGAGAVHVDAGDACFSLTAADARALARALNRAADGLDAPAAAEASVPTQPQTGARSDVSVDTRPLDHVRPADAPATGADTSGAGVSAPDAAGPVSRGTQARDASGTGSAAGSGSGAGALDVPKPAPPRPIPPVTPPAVRQQENPPPKSEPVDLGQGVAILRPALDAAAFRDIPVESIIAAALEPEDTWQAIDGSPRAIQQRGGIGVVMAESADPLVLSVRPADELYEERRAAGAREAGYRRPGTATGSDVPTDMVQLRDRLGELGFELQQTRKHIKVTHAEHPSLQVVIAATPSDHRTWLNVARDIRHVFGIDIREAG